MYIYIYIYLYICIYIKIYAKICELVGLSLLNKLSKLEMTMCDFIEMTDLLRSKAQVALYYKK